MDRQIGLILSIIFILLLAMALFALGQYEGVNDWNQKPAPYDALKFNSLVTASQLEEGVGECTTNQESLVQAKNLHEINSQRKEKIKQKRRKVRNAKISYRDNFK